MGHTAGQGNSRDCGSDEHEDDRADREVHPAMAIEAAADPSSLSSGPHVALHPGPGALEALGRKTDRRETTEDLRRRDESTASFPADIAVLDVALDRCPARPVQAVLESR